MGKITTQDRSRSIGSATPIIIESTGVTVNTSYTGVYATKFTISTTTQAIAAAALGFGIELGTLPKGNICVESVSLDLGYVGSGTTTVTPEIGVGTVVAVGAITTIGAGAATMEDCMDGTNGTAFAATAAKTYNVMAQGEIDQKDGTTTAKTLFLNFAGNWATTETLTFTGSVTVAWYIAHV